MLNILFLAFMHAQSKGSYDEIVERMFIRFSTVQMHWQTTYAFCNIFNDILVYHISFVVVLLFPV